MESGRIFIAYQGVEFDCDDIRSILRTKCTYGYVIKAEVKNNVKFLKLVYNSCLEDRDPYYNSYTNLLTVNGYNQNEMQKVNGIYYNINDDDKLHLVTNYMYRDKKIKMFEELSKYAHFCSVVYDSDSQSLIAGVTEPNNEYTHLYYGYTPRNKKIMFSNNREVLNNFCDDVVEMAPNTYYKDGKFYNLDGTEINKEKKEKFIENSKENADTFFSGLNELLAKITNDAIKSKIEKNVNDYLDSEEPKKRIEDYLLKELDTETKKEVLQIIKQTIDEYNTENKVKETLNNVFNDALEEYSKNVSIPVVHIIKLKDTILGQTQGGFYHEKFEQILSQTQLEEPIMLIGPAGSGKNVAVKQVSDALGLHMYYTNNASNEFKLTGFIDAGGNYRDTEFYKAFKNGGVFFLDEIDNSDPSALIVINSALANGYMAFPHETIDRHPDFRIIAAANTWGKGSDLQYVGRNALDAATLDRFDNIFFDYDKKLEQSLYPNDEILEFMWSFRDAVQQTNTPHVVSTRGIGKVYKKEINGIPVENILTSNVIKNLGQDDLNTIIGSRNKMNDRNKYFCVTKTLKLGK